MRLPARMHFVGPEHNVEHVCSCSRSPEEIDSGELDVEMGCRKEVGRVTVCCCALSSSSSAYCA